MCKCWKSKKVSFIILKNIYQLNWDRVIDSQIV